MTPERREKQREYNRRYRARHPDVARLYRQANQAKLAELKKAWYVQRREKIREYARAYYKANRERIKAWTKAYRVDKDEQYSRYKQKWSDAHREEINAKHRMKRQTPAYQARAAKYVTSHREQLRANTRRYYRKNPKRALAAVHRRLARLRNAVVEQFTLEEIFERDRGVCGFCHEPVPEQQRSLDHIVPLALGGNHTKANVRLAHLICNVREGGRIRARFAGQRLYLPEFEVVTG